MEGLGFVGHGPGDSKELEFTVEFIVGFNGKVSDEGDIEVVMEGKI